jgi:hypothetical protein
MACEYGIKTKINSYWRDTWVSAFGKEKANELLGYEFKVMSAKGNKLYKKAWDWAMAKTYEKRQGILVDLRKSIDQQ